MRNTLLETRSYDGFEETEEREEKIRKDFYNTINRWKARWENNLAISHKISALGGSGNTPQEDIQIRAFEGDTNSDMKSDKILKFWFKILEEAKENYVDVKKYISGRNINAMSQEDFLDRLKNDSSAEYNKLQDA